MKFKTRASSISKQIGLAASIVPANSTDFTLEQIKLILEDDTLTIKSTDLKIFIKTEVEVDGREDGEVLVMGQLLAETLKNLSGLYVTISTDDDGSMTIESDTGNYTIATTTTEYYPQPPELKDVKNTIISAGLFKRFINRSLPYVSKDEMRQAMQGVCINAGRSLEVVATDAHRLIKNTDFSDREEGENLLVPADALKVACGILPDEGDVKIQSDSSNLRITYGKTTIGTRRMDDIFPNYNGVIPDHYDELKVSKKELSDAVKRLLVIANKKTNQVVLDIKRDHIEVSTQDLDYNNSAKETIECDSSNELRVALNGVFLHQALNAIDHTEATIKFGAKNRPVLIEEQNGYEILLILLMPIMLKE